MRTETSDAAHYAEHSPGRVYRSLMLSSIARIWRGCSFMAVPFQKALY
ncbi:hypothetical protein APA386B_1960 [Acetobacter pasteurianus 386B]|nr:hypothetical protein APA386B_1960 [Acetobacter pasteurianus 386B]